MKKQINHQEYCQLLGLLLIAEQHTKAIADVKSAIAKTLLIEESSSAGDWIEDAIYRPYSADELLKRLEIERAV